GLSRHVARRWSRRCAGSVLLPKIRSDYRCPPPGAVHSLGRASRAGRVPRARPSRARKHGTARPGDDEGRADVLIPTVEDGLQSLLRTTLPLSPDVGDVSFDPPSGTWAAQVNRITVSLF